MDHAASPDVQDSEEDDVHEDLPSDSLFPANYNRNRRTSVSAESMAPSENGKDFVKRVIHKTPDQRSRIETSIANNFLFRNLDEDQYKDVLNAMEEKHVPSNTCIIQQGGIGDFFYVVETGSFDCFVDAHDGHPPRKVLDYGPGGSFGELALMYNAPRAATITATSDSVVWALDRVTFRRILMENTSQKRRMYEAFLEEVPLLVSLEPYERQKIADALESQIFDKDSDVIKQGDVGDQFYIIESGEAKAYKEADGHQVEVMTLRKGDYFGELALLNDAPRAATIRAMSRLKVATLGKKAFTRLLGPVVDIIQRNASNYASVSHHVE